MINPCCGFSLRKGAIIIAILDMVGGVVGVLFTVASLLIVTCCKEEVKQFLLKDLLELEHKEFIKLLDESIGIILGILTFMIVICLMQLALATYLLKGARHRKLTKCQMWLKIKCICFIIGLLFILAAVITSENRLLIGVSGLFGIAYQLYTLWVVRAFIHEAHYGISIPTCADEEGFHKL